MNKPVKANEKRHELFELLRAHRGEVLDAWNLRMHDMVQRRGLEQVPIEVIREDIESFLDALLETEEEEEEAFDAVTPWVLQGEQYGLKLADVHAAMLEFKEAAGQVIRRHVDEDRSVLALMEPLNETVEELCMQAAQLYQMTKESELRSLRKRTSEIFIAWEAEQDLRALKRPSQVLGLAAEKLEEIFDLTGGIVKLFDLERRGDDELISGQRIPVPLVKESPPFLTSSEREKGGVINIYERCRRRRQPYVLPEITSEHVVNCAQLEDRGVCSLAAYPLMLGDQVVGTMLLYSSNSGAFQEHHNRMMLDFAGVLAAALVRTAELERSARQMSEREVAARLGRSVLEISSHDELLSAVVHALQSFRDYMEVALFQVDRESGDLVLVAEAGGEKTYLPDAYSQELGKGYIGLCAESGETLLATDLEGDPRRHIAFEEERLAKSELCVPIKKGDELLGVLHLESKRTEAFPQSEIRALENLSTHIAVAIENARMLEQQRRSEYELQQARHHIENIIRSTAVGITSCDKTGLYSHWSPSCERMLGFRAEEVVGKKRPTDLVADDFDLQASLEACLEEGQTTAERRFLTKDGDVRIIQEARVPMHEASGEHVGFTSYLVDITERKKSEERLRQERDTLNLVVDSMGAGLGLFDGQKRLQFANRTLAQWFECGTDPVGTPCHEVFGCDSADCDGCPLEQALRTGVRSTCTGELTDSRGVWHCYQLVANRVEHGETRILALTLDITEQRRRTEQLALINRLIKAIKGPLDLDKALRVILTCVTAGHALGFNRAFVFLTDSQSERLEGRLAVGPGSQEEATAIWSEISARGETLEDLLESARLGESDHRLTERVRKISVPIEDSGELLTRTIQEHKSLTVRNATEAEKVDSHLVDELSLSEFVCAPLVARGESLGVIVADNKFSGNPIESRQVQLLEMFCGQAALTIANARAYQKIRDQMDELRQTQQKLIESERLASIGQMAGHLAHEIRNPLATIGGFAKSIAKHTSDGSRVQQNAQIIYDECIRLENILANVLDYSKPVKPEKEPVQLNKLVRDTLQQFENLIEENDIDVECDFDESLGEVVADGRMIKQVVINILKNSIEAVEDEVQGNIRLATGQDGSEVVFTVTDNGPGIEEGVRERLFSPFFTTKVGGSGLGLSVTRRIVRQHGGDIDFESSPGEGTSFYVKLPKAPQEDQDEG